MKTIISILALAAICVGCSTTPPTYNEQRYFDIKTNVVEIVVTKTNIIPIEFTNSITSFVTNITFQTNIVEKYEYSPGQLAQDTAATAGNIANLFAPGLGGAITGLALGIFSIYGRLRTSRKTNEVLAQGIEIYGEVVKAVEGATGKNLDAEVKSWLQQHQAEAGVIQEVLSILDRSVDNDKAKIIAQEIKQFIANRQ